MFGLIAAPLLLGPGMAGATEASVCEAITTVNVVDIQPGMTREARAYYEAGWAAARKIAAERGLIADYNLLVSESGVTDDPEILLITTYANREQYAAREEHFQAIFREMELDGPILIEGRSRAEILGTVEGAEDYRSVFASGGDCGVPGHGQVD
ncbi:MAG: hypothetical protein ACX930_04015 [Erythrobacter sp.]